MVVYRKEPIQACLVMTISILVLVDCLKFLTVDFKRGLGYICFTYV